MVNRDCKSHCTECYEFLNLLLGGNLIYVYISFHSLVFTVLLSVWSTGTVSGEDSVELNFVCTDCNRNLKTYAELKSHRIREHGVT